MVTLPPFFSLSVLTHVAPRDIPTACSLMQSPPVPSCLRVCRIHVRSNDGGPAHRSVELSRHAQTPLVGQELRVHPSLHAASKPLL